MSKKQKINLCRIVLSAFFLIAFSFIPIKGLPRLLLFMIPYLIAGYDVLLKAAKGLWNHQLFDESLLMSIATLGAVVLAVLNDGDYTEAIAVMLFYQIGEWFQSYAVGKSRKNISALMDLCPDIAHLESEDGSLIDVDPDEIEVGSIFLVQPGEKIPLDGTVVSGTSLLNTSALTGESLPCTVGETDFVYSGCINLNGVLRIRATQPFEESTASKILELIEDASSRKAHAENFIAKFSRYYTPIVVLSALLLAIIPPLGRMIYHLPPEWMTWIYRALTFLVISCPCALVVSIPLTFFAGIGSASRQGILMKGSNYLEALASVNAIAFDKTGTLTEGSFKVVDIHPELISEQELLHMAAHAERFSTHPIAQSLRSAYPEESDNCEVADIKEISGLGITAMINGKKVWVGNEKLMDLAGVSWHPCHLQGTVIHACMEGQYIGHIIISDTVKPTAAKAVQELRKVGVARFVLLTGDHEKVAKEIAGQLDIDEVYSDLLPQDKVSVLEKILQEPSREGTLAFVGDGINDAPVLSRSDIGIAMGGLGSDAAIEAADIVLMDDNPLKISDAVRISRKCMRIVRENIIFSISVKIICLLLGALGITNMWAAVFADVGVMVLAVLNAIRAMFIKNSFN